MQKEIVNVDNLLNDNGTLKNTGWAKQMILRYNREDIKKKSRIKEWDYYLITDNRYVLCLTISNLSYAAVLSASVVDLFDKTHIDKTSMKMFPKNKNFMPTASGEGNVVFETKDASFSFEISGKKRLLKGSFKNFYSQNGLNRDLEFNITIDDIDEESMVKATPFKNKNHFYFNQKKGAMPAEGKFTYKGKNYTFEKQSTYAIMDWGRGVLPYNSQWYWANFFTLSKGRRICVNLGDAFGDDSDACENAVFVDGKLNKLEDVKIYIGRKGLGKDYLNPWTFYTDDGRVELIFEPIVDRSDPIDYIVLRFVPHQVFGRFSGKVVLDSGEKIEISNVLGFAENVVNRW